MAFKRLVASVFVKDGLVVKSYGFKKWKPCGNLITTLRNLDRWQVDEILLLDISRQSNLDDQILRQIKDSKISTPLIYGGGIRILEDVYKLMDVGCDRLVLETLVLNNSPVVEEISKHFGKQALIASLVLNKDNSKNINLWDYKYNKPSSISLEKAIKITINSMVSEILLIDKKNEGSIGKFDLDLMNSIKTNNLKNFNQKIIWFGGIDLDICKKLILSESTVGIAFGNSNFESELFIPKVRERLHNILKEDLIR